MCTISWQKRTRNALCAAVNSWTICSLYRWKCKSWCKICRTLLSDKFKSWECRHTDRRGLLSKAILTRWLFSGDLTVFRRVRALTCTDPVSRYWCSHLPIIFLEGAAPRCRSSPNFRRNSRCTNTMDLLNMNCSCTAARTNVPLFTETKSTLNPTTVVRDPSHNPHKHYCHIKMGNVKCHTLYIAYLLPPWSRVLLEKLTGSQLVKKFPHFMEP